MAAHQKLDFDKLGEVHFQSLCNSLLVRHFSPNVVPFGSKGADGGIDALFSGLPPNSAWFDGCKECPNRYQIPAKSKPGIWIFQCKYTEKVRTVDQLAAVKKTFRAETAKWSGKKKPNFYILLTNVVLKPSTRQELEALARKAKFPFFEVWDGHKLECLVACDDSIRKTYFPNCEDQNKNIQSIALGLKELTKSFKGKAAKKSRTRTKGITLRIASVSKVPSSESLTSSVESLATFEIGFTRINEAFKANYVGEKEPTGIPDDWQRLIVKAEADGILSLNEKDKTTLSVFANAVHNKRLLVTKWSRYLGEETKLGEELLELAFPFKQLPLAKEISKKLFRVEQGANTAHLVVQKHLRNSEAEIISSLKANRASEVQDLLVEFYRVRQRYVEHKKELNNAFYPNNRSLGSLHFGWDFISTWDHTFENICDVAFKANQPVSVYKTIFHIPDSLCVESIRNRYPVERFKSELSTFYSTIWKMPKDETSVYSELLERSLEHIAYALHDLEHVIKSEGTAKWAISVIESFCEFLGVLGKLTLHDNFKFNLSRIQTFLSLATSQKLFGILDNDDGAGDFKDRYEAQKQLSCEIHLIQREVVYSWATYSWNLARKTSIDPKVAFNFLNQVSSAEAVKFYNRGLNDKLGNWYSNWFRPNGTRAVWSSSVDHDIRETMLATIAMKGAAEKDLTELGTLETSSGYSSFLSDLETQYKLLQEHGYDSLRPLDELRTIVSKARTAVDDRFNRLIRNQRILSAKKVAEVKDDFRKKLDENDPSGWLYPVEIIGAESTHKPKWFPGIYTVMEKVWFVEDTGHAGYSISGMGGHWAEALLNHKDDLLCRAAKKAAKHEAYDSAEFEAFIRGLKETYGSDFILVMAVGGIPWRIANTHFVHDRMGTNGKERVPGRSGKIGELEVFYSRFLKRGEFIVIKKGSIVWKTKGICREPTIETIYSDSDLAKRFLKDHPTDDLQLKVIVTARENGDMVADVGCKAVYYKMEGEFEELE